MRYYSVCYFWRNEKRSKMGSLYEVQNKLSIEKSFYHYVVLRIKQYLLSKYGNIEKQNSASKKCLAESPWSSWISEIWICCNKWSLKNSIKYIQIWSKEIQKLRWLCFSFCDLKWCCYFVWKVGNTFALVVIINWLSVESSFRWQNIWNDYKNT